MSSDLINLAQSLRRSALASNQRKQLVLAGSRGWCRSQSRHLLARLDFSHPVWIGETGEAAVAQFDNQQAESLLGKECDGLVYDAFNGFDADAFGSVCGALQGGGLLLLLTPPLDEWCSYEDPQHKRIAVAGTDPSQVSGRFLERLTRLVRSDDSLVLVEEGEPLPEHLETCPATSQQAFFEQGCRTGDQLAAVEAVIHAATGHRHRPVVLISDRGRGKSSALGIAAARLLQQDGARLLVTAPRLAAVEMLFKQAASLLPGAELSKGAVHLGRSLIRYSAPDHLLLHPQPAGLLLVDEAAAIPTPILEALLDHYPRIAFATTIHGYEGTGRGFDLRFRKVLERRFPQWREIRLETPIRWAAGDPLEAWLFRALALNASPPPDAMVAAAVIEECMIEQLERDRLAHYEQDLTDLFGLLVLAHYRTTPFDLRHLLDGPNLQIFVLRYQHRIVATALMAEEGGFDEQLAHAIWRGDRRPRGHLLAQSLAAHCGLESAARLKGGRIMRIAVHPVLWKRGLGRKLVSAIKAYCRKQELDYLGSSFGATSELLSFWSRCELQPIRIGMRRGASSGTQSTIVFHPLSPAGKDIFDTARRRFNKQLPSLLGDPLKEMDASLAAVLLQQKDNSRSPALNRLDWQDLAGYAFARRGYETSLPAIRELALTALADGLADIQTRKLLVMRVLQGQDWPVCAKSFGLTGRADVERRLRALIGELIMHYGDVQVSEFAKRLSLGPSGPEKITMVPASD
jgi:tRNA(Met) cytidine acetyltransferase